MMTTTMITVSKLFHHSTLEKNSSRCIASSRIRSLNRNLAWQLLCFSVVENIIVLVFYKDNMGVWRILGCPLSANERFWLQPLVCWSCYRTPLLPILSLSLSLSLHLLLSCYITYLLTFLSRFLTLLSFVQCSRSDSSFWTVFSRYYTFNILYRL